MPYFSIGNITFDNSLHTHGLRFVLEDVEGWDAPEVVIDSVPRAESDGSFVTKGRYSHREVVLRGTAYGNGLESPWRAREFIMQQVGGAVRGPKDLFYTDSVGTKFLSVHLNGRVRTERAGPYGITFEIPMIAPDPRKYSTIEQTVSWNLPSGAQEATQAISVGGTYNTFWTAVLTGDVVLPRLKNLTQAGEPYLAIDLTVFPSYAVAIDSKARTINQIFTNRYDALNLNLSRWWPLAGGRVNNIRFARQTAGSGTGNIVLKWRDAWI